MWWTWNIPGHMRHFLLIMFKLEFRRETETNTWGSLWWNTSFQMKLSDSNRREDDPTETPQTLRRVGSLSWLRTETLCWSLTAAALLATSMWDPEVLVTSAVLPLEVQPVQFWSSSSSLIPSEHSYLVWMILMSHLLLMNHLRPHIDVEPNIYGHTYLSIYLLLYMCICMFVYV